MFTAVYEAGWGWDELLGTFLHVAFLIGLLVSSRSWVVRFCLWLSASGLIFGAGHLLERQAHSAWDQAFREREACLPTCGCPPYKGGHASDGRCPPTHWCHETCECIDFRGEKPTLYLTLSTAFSPFWVFCGATLRLALDALWAWSRRRRGLDELLRSDPEA